MDQAASAHQAILRHIGKCGEDADLDRSVRPRADCDRQGAAAAGGAALHIAILLQVFSVTIFEKMPIKSAILAIADDTEQSPSDNQLNPLTF